MRECVCERERKRERERCLFWDSPKVKTIFITDVMRWIEEMRGEGRMHGGESRKRKRHPRP